MTKEEKRKIEQMLYNLPQLKSQIQTRLINLDIEYPIKGMDYDRIVTGKTNEVYSDVEEYVINKITIPKELQEMMKKRDSVLTNLNSLTNKEYDLINDRYWNDKTYEEMADGTHGTWRWQTIWEWIDKIIKEKLKGLKKIK